MKSLIFGIVLVLVTSGCAGEVAVNCVCEGADVAETYIVEGEDPNTGELVEDEFECDGTVVFVGGLDGWSVAEEGEQREEQCCTGDDCSCTCTEA